MLVIPGFLEPQSAHVPFPETDLIRSCKVRSLRACWRLFRADAMVSRGGTGRTEGEGEIRGAVEGARGQQAGCEELRNGEKAREVQRRLLRSGGIHDGVE